MMKISAVVLAFVSTAASAQAYYYPQTATPTVALIEECKQDAPSLGSEKLAARIEECKRNPLYVMCYMEGVGRTKDKINPAFAERVLEKCRRQVGYRPGEYEEEQRLTRQANREYQNAQPERDAANRRESEQIRQRNEQYLREQLAERDRQIAREAPARAEREQRDKYHADDVMVDQILRANNQTDKYQAILAQCHREQQNLKLQEQRRTGIEPAPHRAGDPDPCRAQLNQSIIQQYNQLQAQQRR